MKLQTKFILTLLSATLLALIGAQTFQQVLGGKALNNLSRENLGLLEQREQSHADDIYQAIDPVVEETISLGEMSKLDALICIYTNIDGVLEYSIYDNKGVAACSTSRTILKSKKSLPADLKDQLLASPAKFARRTDEAFEIYQPLIVTDKCLECHDDLKKGAIGGVALLRLSTDTLVKSKQSWNIATAKIQNADIKAAISTTLAIALMFSGLVYLTVKRLVTAPIGRIIANLKQGAEQLNGSSTEISASSQILAEGASEQAAALEETSASLEELSSMTKRNAENSQNVNEIAKQTRTAADKSVNDMQAMTSAMEAIKTSSDDIAKIIKTIDEIAFQTNILALNAAVEAARAGEAGLGFAVVADEVRNLAQRSAQAAKETAAKIEGAISKTGQGVSISTKVAEALNEIVTKARQVDELAAEVASASHEQTQGITQINAAVGQMDKVTQSNAAGAEESAAAAEELNAQAVVMKESVNELLKLVGGLSGEADQQGFSEEPVAMSAQNGHSHKRESFQKVRPVEAHRPTSDIPMPEDRRVHSQKGVITWDEAQMSTGVESIDSQHQELIRRINELHSACLAGTAREDLLKLLGFLGEYAQSHFRHEEGVMQSHRCPARGQNKAAHVQFLRDYGSLVEIVKRDGATTTAVIQVKELLGNWLKNHICGTDTKLRTCVGNGCPSRNSSVGTKADGFRDF